MNSRLSRQHGKILSPKPKDLERKLQMPPILEKISDFLFQIRKTSAFILINFILINIFKSPNSNDKNGSPIKQLRRAFKETSYTFYMSRNLN